MNSKVLLMLSLVGLSTFVSYAQKRPLHQAGLNFGFSTYAGDVGGGLNGYNFVENLMGGLMYKIYKNDLFSYRASIYSINFVMDDSSSLNQFRKNRGYKLFNSLFEFYAGVEFNFFKFNPYSEYSTNKKITPYISSGLALIIYQEKSIGSNGIVRQNGIALAPSFPVIIGAKTKIDDKIVFSMEVSAAYALTDNLDASDPKGGELSFGDYSNDWYFNLSFGIMYIINDVKCHCLPPISEERPDPFRDLKEDRNSSTDEENQMPEGETQQEKKDKKSRIDKVNDRKAKRQARKAQK